MAAPDPGSAARLWATVLSGTANDATVHLGDGTQIVVIEGPTAGLVEIQLEVCAALAVAAERAGADADGGSLLLADPDGWAVRFDNVANVAPLQLERSTLSHCTLLSPEPMRSCEYWQDLGFRLSESVGDIFGWLRPNPVHHSLAFVSGGQAAIQHLAVELPDAAALIAAVDALVEAGAQVEFGPGRHLVGGNLFVYVVDDLGLRWELCAELRRVPEDEPTIAHPESIRAKSINLFGPRPPLSFIEQAGGPGPLSGLSVH